MVTTGVPAGASEDWIRPVQERRIEFAPKVAATVAASAPKNPRRGRGAFDDTFFAWVFVIGGCLKDPLGRNVAAKNLPAAGRRKEHRTLRSFFLCDLCVLCGLIVSEP
jgi:hypothetical protein